MGDVTHKQHYVFRQYLAPWTKNNSSEGQVFCEKLDKHKTMYVSLSKICAKRDMYAIGELTDQEVLLCQKLVESKSKRLNETNHYWATKYQSLSNLARRAQASDNLSLQKEATEMLVEAGENLQSAYEAGLTPAMNKELLSGTANFMKNEESRSSFCAYLAMQFCRTMFVRDAIILALDRLKKKVATVHEDSMANLMQICYATNIGSSFFNGGFEIHFLSLEFDGFLTGDQPVFNITENLNVKGGAVGTAMYYPVSPRLAILFTNEAHSLIQKKLTPGDVDFLNGLVRQRAREYIIFPYPRNK